MRKTNTFEIVGIGEFTRFPITRHKAEYKAINKEGVEVEKHREGTLTYYWVDNEGNKYSESEVFYAIGDKKVQKVKKTEKVSSYEVVDKTEVYDFLAEGFAVVDGTETTLRNFNRKVKENEALKFKIKLSSNGLKFDIAYILKWCGSLLMISGGGKISEGIKEFSLMKKTESKTKTLKQVIEVSADELEKEIEI